MHDGSARKPENAAPTLISAGEGTRRLAKGAATPWIVMGALVLVIGAAAAVVAFSRSTGTSGSDGGISEGVAASARQPGGGAAAPGTDLTGLNSPPAAQTRSVPSPQPGRSPAGSFPQTSASPLPAPNEIPGQPAEPDGGAPYEELAFSTPSGNIYCGAFGTGGVECVLLEHDFEYATCEEVSSGGSIERATVGVPSAGQALDFFVPATGNADVPSGCDGGNALTMGPGSDGFPPVSYGTSVQGGGVTCSVAESGVTCRNADGHGFQIARAAYNLF